MLVGAGCAICHGPVVRQGVRVAVGGVPVTVGAVGSGDAVRVIVRVALRVRVGWSVGTGLGTLNFCPALGRVGAAAFDASSNTRPCARTSKHPTKSTIDGMRKRPGRYTGQTFFDNMVLPSHAILSLLV